MNDATAAQDMPRRAMVLAAGRGERLRPLTDRLPKPLVEIRGKTMLDRALDRLAAAGVTGAVVNLHHLGDQIEAHLAVRTRPNITLSREPELLDTGGGVCAALQWLGEAAFFVLNGDVVWLEGIDPDPRIPLTKISYEEYVARARKDLELPAPPLYRDLLHGDGSS